MSRTMARRVHRALEDENLQKALGRLTPLLRLVRQSSMRGVRFDEQSEAIHEVKERSIAILPELVVQFKDKAAQAGATVYEAADAEDANRYVLGVARRRGVEHIVKSKSMLTEEIGLREYLEEAGIEVRETDIGEWIVQLAGERPAHMVGPAIHKTVEQVAELLSKGTGEKLEPDPPVLLDASRRALRQSYLNADMGISGANIAIAETGTVVIVTNEANGCMVTTLPDVHVAMVGYEKLVASLEDANVILNLLSRSTMGMKMPVYVSYITGPSRLTAIAEGIGQGGQGPSEMHIVLVDNGRSRMRELPQFREALYCIKCGACLNVCPVFQSVAGQTYGYIYQGGIGAVLTAFLHGMDKAKGPASLCLGCMACKEVCPARIDIPGMVNLLRVGLAEAGGLSWKERLAYRHVLGHPRRLDGAMRIASRLQHLFTRNDDMMRWLPYPLNSLTRTISLPTLQRRPLRDRRGGAQVPAGEAKPRVAFFAGCVADYAYPDLGEHVLDVLRSKGAEARYAVGQTCCGAPAWFAGEAKTALGLAKRNIAALEESNPDYIVTVCPGCAEMLKQEYPRLTASEPEWKERAEAIGVKVCDFSQVALQLTPSREKRPSAGKKITYHDPCHLRRGLGVYCEPRELLEREGFELVEMAGSDTCCGFGGDTVLRYPELSNSVLQRKLDAIEAAEVDTVVTNCAPCILQLRGGLDKRRSQIRVVHTAELLATCPEVRETMESRLGPG
ncbi:MAG: L-lactate dehydrogenase (quinone) large subunit LdhH [Chloroflexota bacterium]